MHIGELASKIQENLKSLVGERNIRIHLQNFTEEKSKPTYIEFKLPDKKHEQDAFQLYKRLSKLIRRNYSQIDIGYNTPYFHPQNSHIRRIVIKIDENLKTGEKQELLKKAALDFNHILKSCRKYGIKK